ncbi:TonB family protein [Aurantibacillus circumpalustris]|uniref:TonB family protein n=1 Tax=Aurantibacillus circumpalustris TaxID=3036359 RepID=UPI00295C1294|nr:TonB family protein [Aurantibacillus circumpalustris]
MRQNNILFLFVLLFGNSVGQTKIFFDKYWNETKTTDEAIFYKILHKDVNDSNIVLEKAFYLTDTLKWIKKYSDFLKGNIDGTSKSFYSTGQLKEIANYTNGYLNGELKTYWQNGHAKRDDSYEMGKLVDGKTYDSTGKQITYFNYEKAPEYPGGIKELINFLKSNVKYPDIAKADKISGKVLIQFMVDEEGTIRNVKILKSISPELDEEALRVVRGMPTWTPGQIDGTTVHSYFNLPISFKL